MNIVLYNKCLFGKTLTFNVKNEKYRGIVSSVSDDLEWCGGSIVFNVEETKSNFYSLRIFKKWGGITYCVRIRNQDNGESLCDEPLVDDSVLLRKFMCDVVVSEKESRQILEEITMISGLRRFTEIIEIS